MEWLSFFDSSTMNRIEECKGENTFLQNFLGSGVCDEKTVAGHPSTANRISLESIPGLFVFDARLQVWCSMELCIISSSTFKFSYSTSAWIKSLFKCSMNGPALQFGCELAGGTGLCGCWNVKILSQQSVPPLVSSSTSNTTLESSTTDSLTAT